MGTFLDGRCVHGVRPENSSVGAHSGHYRLEHFGSGVPACAASAAGTASTTAEVVACDAGTSVSAGVAVLSSSTIDTGLGIETGSFGIGFPNIVIPIVIIIIIRFSSRLPKNGLLGTTTFPRGLQDGVGIVG